MSMTTNTPLTMEAEESLEAIYYSFGQSASSIVINLMIVIWLKMAFQPKLVYQILIVESAVNLVGLLGFFIMWTIASVSQIPRFRQGSIAQDPETSFHLVMCTIAAALTSILIFNFYLSNLLIACPRRFKIQASVKGLPIPCDQSIFKRLAKYWAAIFLYLSLLAIINAVSETHALLPYEICLHSNHLAETMSLERWQNWLMLIPLYAIVLINIYFDYDDIAPSFSAINPQENIPPTWDKTPIKTCYISLVPLLVRPLVHLDVMDIEDQGIRLIWFNTFLVVSLLKAPIIAQWTYYYHKKNTVNQAQPENYLELHPPIPSISSETI